MTRYVLKGPFPLYELCRIALIVTKSWPNAMFCIDPDGLLHNVPQNGGPIALTLYKDQDVREGALRGDVTYYDSLVEINVSSDYFSICSSEAGTGAKLADQIKALFWHRSGDD